MIKYNYLKTVDSEWFRQRLSGTAIFVLAVFLILIARLFYLQVVKGAEFRRLSQNNCVRLQSIAPARGLIFDRNNYLMVDNRPSFNVSIVLEDAKNPEKVLSKLAAILGVDCQDLLAKLDVGKGWPSFKPILLIRDLDRDAIAVVESHKLDLPGILIKVEPIRHYVEGKCASHLIGYLGEISEDELVSGDFPDNRGGDFIGRFGVEKSYESYFRGKPGRRQVQVNVLGQVKRVLKTVSAEAGKNVHLTLDIGLQRKAEEMFAEKVGAAVAMDPSNGHILAMVSSPAFNPNAFVEGMSFEAWDELVNDKFHPMRNKAIQGQYPPGSTYKIITAMAGFKEGVIDEDTLYYCPGYYRYGNRTYRCWNRGGHGSVGITKAIIQSCDVFFFQVGEELGVDRLARYAKACGLGNSTGIELDNEASGLVPTSAWKLKKIGVPWQRGETLSVAIGQGFNLVTPMQMVSLISAVANGGMRHKPLFVKRIEDIYGKVRFIKPEPIGKLPVSDETLQLIKSALVGVVSTRRGTGRSARIEGIEMAGKTGTAQVIALKEDSDEVPDDDEVPFRFRDHAWFVAFAPAQAPKIAVSVLVEHGGHGGSTAGPIAREMIKEYLGI